jgi:hypothetical protein
VHRDSAKNNTKKMGSKITNITMITNKMATGTIFEVFMAWRQKLFRKQKKQSMAVAGVERFSSHSFHTT